MRIDERIGARHADLSPQERKAADTLLEHLDDLGTYRATELATLAGVSKATMSRLFRSLGFVDFDEVRDHLRALRAGGEPRHVDGRADLAEHVERETRALTTAMSHLSSGAIHAMAGAVARARSVTVVGWRNSHPVALHLRQQLVQARPDVRLAPLPGQVMGEELADLGPDDVLLVVAFRRRPAGMAEFLVEAGRTGAHVTLIADQSGRHLAAHAATFVECPVESVLAFDSYAAAMSIVSVLADAVLAAGGRASTTRVSAISAGYHRLGEVE